MASNSLSIHPYSYKFIKPFKTANNAFSERKGFYLSLKVDDLTAYAECAPLPGFSPESLDSCLETTEKYAQQIADKTALTSEIFYNWLHPTIEEPSLRFALSVLHEDLEAQRNGSFFGEKLKLHVKELNVPLNAVFGLVPTNELIAHGLNKLAIGYKCIKLKAPEKSIPALVEIMQIWHQKYPKALFRLDANGEWSPQNCVKILNELAATALPIEYVEQPFMPSTVSEMEKLVAVSPIPIAADEMLADSRTANTLIRNKAVDFLVVKPPLIGSLKQVLALIDNATAKKIQVVITTLLDSGLNRNIHAILAAYIVNKQPLFAISHGLSTGDILSTDLCQSSLTENATHWHVKPFTSIASLFLASAFPKATRIF